MNLPVWEDRARPLLPRLQGTVQADVCAVGLGGSGLAALEELAAAGVHAANL